MHKMCQKFRRVQEKARIFQNQQYAENKKHRRYHNCFLLPCDIRFKFFSVFLFKPFFSKGKAVVYLVYKHSGKIHRRGGNNKKNRQLAAVYHVKNIA